MPDQTKTAIARGRRTAKVGAVALFLMTASTVVGLSGVSTATSDGDGTAVDVVFVFDSSQSVNEDRYHITRELDALPDRLDAGGVDARYALITYNESVRTELRPTGDFEEFERAMHFPESGNVERASPALATATNLSFRDDAETVVVVVTDEDDDSSSAARAETLSRLSEVTEFVAVSPATPQESSCDVHSPPCDGRSDNELRTMAESVGGTWVDVDGDAEEIVESVGDAVVSATTGADGEEASPRTRSESGSSDSDDDPSFETIERSGNRTTAETGDPVAFVETVVNDGSAGGTYRTHLSHRGTVLDEQTVYVPEGATRTVTFVRRFDEVGTYEIHVGHGAAETVEVVRPRNATVETTVRADGTGLRANVSDARVNGTVSVPLTDIELAEPDAVELVAATLSLGDPNVTPSHDVAFDVAVESRASPPDGVVPLPASVSNPTYLRVNGSLGDDLAGVGFEYAATSSDATLYRYDRSASTWTPAERREVAGEDGRWRTETADCSTFAIGVRQPAFVVSDVEIEDRTVERDEAVSVVATITNEGTAAGTYNATVTADGTPVASERLRIPANETHQVTLSYVPERAGVYAVAVGEAPPLTLRVDETTTTSASEVLTARNETSGVRGAEQNVSRLEEILPLAVAILFGVAALGLVARRRR